MDFNEQVLDHPSFVMEGIIVKPSTNELIADQKVPLIEDKVMKVLVYLVKHRSRIVSREELFTNLWPDVYVSQDSLNRCISIIRKLWGTAKGQTPVVRTIRNRGYRVVGQISSYTETQSPSRSANSNFQKAGYVASGVVFTLGMISVLLLFYCVL